MIKKTIPHIVIEGPDKAGKSTLAKFLSEELGLPIMKFSAPEAGQNPFDQYIGFLAQAQTPHILDRFYMSELTYGPLKRAGTSINDPKKFLIEAALKGMGAMCILASDGEQTLIERMEQDGETFLKKEEVLPLLNLFDKEIGSSILHWKKYKVGDSMAQIKAFYQLYHQEGRKKGEGDEELS